MTPEEARMRAYAIMGHEDITMEWIDQEGLEPQGIGWYAWDNGHMELGPKFIGRWKFRLCQTLSLKSEIFFTLIINTILKIAIII